MALLTAELHTLPAQTIADKDRAAIGKRNQSRFQLWQGMQYGLPNRSNAWQRYRQKELRTPYIDYVPEGEDTNNGRRLRIWLGRTAGHSTVALVTQPIEKTSIGPAAPIYASVGSPVIRAETRGPEVFIHINGYGLVSPDLFDRIITSPDDQIGIIETHLDTVDHLTQELSLPRPISLPEADGTILN